MPLVKKTLEEQLYTVLTSEKDNEDVEQASRNVANGLATAIDDYLKSATVTVNVKDVVTVGTATTQKQTLPVPAIGDGMLNPGGLS